MKKIWTLSATVLLAAGALAACGQESTPPEATQPPEPVTVTYDHYVALGDSYAALGSRSAETSGPEHCLRGADNYPAGISGHERVEVTDDLTCSGAITDDLIMPSGEGENMIAPQVDALNDETDLVTISIGGNDIDFPGIAACFQETAMAGAQSNCAARFDAEALRAGLDEKLSTVYDTVAERSPTAYVYVTGYVPLISAEGECPDAAFLSAEDRAWVASLTEDLNAQIEAAAAEHGFSFVMPEGAEEHTACAAPEERWADITGLETDSYPMHPTALGQEAMAEAVKEKL